MTSPPDTAANRRVRKKVEYWRAEAIDELDYDDNDEESPPSNPRKRVKRNKPVRRVIDSDESEGDGANKNGTDADGDDLDTNDHGEDADPSSRRSSRLLKATEERQKIAAAQEKFEQERVVYLDTSSGLTLIDWDSYFSRLNIIATIPLNTLNDDDIVILVGKRIYLGTWVNK